MHCSKHCSVISRKHTCHSMTAFKPAAMSASSCYAGQNLTRSPIVGSPYEGLSARRSTYHTPRRETCSAILDLVVQQGVLLIKAPPHSGKTALLQLLQQAAGA